MNVRLSVENKELREQNLKLESKLLDIVLNNKPKKAKLVYGDRDQAVEEDGGNEDIASPAVTSIEVPELVSGMLTSDQDMLSLIN